MVGPQEKLPISPGDTAVTVRGVVRTVTYRTGDQAFSVVRLTAVDGSELTVVGPLGNVAEGEPVRVTGRWEDNRAHGRQLRAFTVVPELPGTPEGIQRLLGSGFVQAIGPKLAQRIVDRFGSSTLDVIADLPERLREVEGIGQTRAVKIQEAFRARRAEVESKAFMQAVGIGPALARRVWERFGAETPRVVRDNPYRLAEEVVGIGFLTADRIGKELKIADDDPRRAAGAALYLLLEGIDSGHTGMPPDELVVLADRLGVAREVVLEAITRLTARGLTIIDRGLVYPPPLHTAEVTLARRLGEVVRKGVAPVDPRVLRAPAVANALAPLATLQRDAVIATLDSPVMVLTGGPGTGKTTTVRALVALHHAVGAKVVLAAPTGRAARRLSEATDHPASTLHRALEWTPRLQSFVRNASTPLDADLVLIDEASMLDVQLAAALVLALRPGARVVFVGDVDQLPPVGPGTVLADLLATPGIRSVRLTEVFRQATASAIVRGAYAVLRGDVPRTSPPRARGLTAPPMGELYFVKCDDGIKAAALLVDTVSRRLPEAFGLHPVRDVQVLVPTHRGPLGAQALNEALQAALNPGAPKGRRGFAVGDKVMQQRNDYDLDVWNGDVGTIAQADETGFVVEIDGRPVVYTPAAAESLTLAYAATVHKAQGSEYEAVVVGLHTSHYVLLNRALLYTAITRAKRLVVLVGSEHAVKIAVKTTREAQRHGALRERLRETVGG